MIKKILYAIYGVVVVYFGAVFLLSNTVEGYFRQQVDQAQQFFDARGIDAKWEIVFYSNNLWRAEVETKLTLFDVKVDNNKGYSTVLFFNHQVQNFSIFPQNSNVKNSAGSIGSRVVTVLDEGRLSPEVREMIDQGFSGGKPFRMTSNIGFDGATNLKAKVSRFTYRVRGDSISVNGMEGALHFTPDERVVRSTVKFGSVETQAKGGDISISPSEMTFNFQDDGGLASKTLFRLTANNVAIQFTNKDEAGFSLEVEYLAEVTNGVRSMDASFSFNNIQTTLPLYITSAGMGLNASGMNSAGVNALGEIYSDILSSLKLKSASTEQILSGAELNEQIKLRERAIESAIQKLIIPGESKARLNLFARTNEQGELQTDMQLLYPGKAPKFSLAAIRGGDVQEYILRMIEGDLKIEIPEPLAQKNSIFSQIISSAAELGIVDQRNGVFRLKASLKNSQFLVNDEVFSLFGTRSAPVAKSSKNQAPANLVRNTEKLVKIPRLPDKVFRFLNSSEFSMPTRIDSYCGFDSESEEHPYFIQGDFDGDGATDYAVDVESKREMAIFVFLANDRILQLDGWERIYLSRVRGVINTMDGRVDLKYDAIEGVKCESSTVLYVYDIVSKKFNKFFTSD